MRKANYSGHQSEEMKEGIIHQDTEHQTNTGDQEIKDTGIKDHLQNLKHQTLMKVHQGITVINSQSVGGVDSMVIYR